METLKSAIELIQEFFQTPTGQFVKSLLLAFGGAFGLWVKERREDRRAALAKLDKKTERQEERDEREEDEERDWRLRALRTEGDLVHLDGYAERLNLKINHVSKHWLLGLEKHDLASTEGKVFLETIRYILADLELEIEAHKKERPGYLKRLQEGKKSEDKGE